MIHVMDFAADSTNVFRRNGHVYPYFKSATIGYGYGHMKHDDDHDVPNPGHGPCANQIAPECHEKDWFDHLEAHNKYNGGAMPRKVEAEKIRQKALENAAERASEEVAERASDGSSISRAESVKVVADNQWNSMHLKDFWNPKVFLCKAGRFFEHLHSNHLDPDYPETFDREEFGTENFKHSCDVNDFDPQSAVRSSLDASEDNGNSNSEFVNNSENDQVETDSSGDQLIEARSGRIEVSDESVNEMPLLIFEGLPEKSIDQTEEDLVRSILEETVDMPKTSVIKAVRLPMTSQTGKSLVMVQMDNQEDEIIVLEHKSDIRSSKVRSLSLDHVGIRELNYEELWNKVQELTVVKRVVPSTNKLTSNQTQKSEDSDAIVMPRQPKIIKFENNED